MLRSRPSRRSHHNPTAATASAIERVEDRMLLSATQIADINTLGESFSEGVELNGKYLFAADHPEIGRELWISDGTKAGTELLKDITPGADGSEFFQMHVFGNAQFFGVQSGDRNLALWQTDGTAAGTVLVRDLGQGLGSLNFRESFMVGSEMFFTLGNKKLWKTDGTAAGTELVFELNPTQSIGGFIGNLTAFKGRVYFQGFSPQDSDDGLWQSDGTAAGTFRVSASGDGVGPSMYATADSLYFFGRDAEHGWELWRSDGTASGTQILKDINPGAADATEDGSSFLTNVGESFATLGNDVFFTANDGVHGVELWKTDGTEAGTVLVRDIEPGSGNSDAIELINFSGALYFSLYEGTQEGRLWRTDGTTAGTTPTNDLISLNENTFLEAFTVSNDLMFVSAYESTDEALLNHLWSTDGTSGGTTLLGTFEDLNEIGLYPQAVGSSVFFNAYSNEDEGLWKSDGTVAGTQLVSELFSNGSSPRDVVRVGQTVYFTAVEGFTERSLWKTDGTVTGTSLVSSAVPDLSTSNDIWATASGNKLFFRASTDTGNGSHEDALWHSDGTDTGTTALRSFPADTQLYDLFDADGLLYFIAGHETNGEQLWKSDGTAAGTILVMDLQSGGVLTDSYILAADGNSIYLNVTNAETEAAGLWTSDGTAAGTIPLGNFASGVYELVVNGDKGFFSADNGTHGEELWVTDGTVAGTSLVADILAGEDGSFPFSFNVVDGKVLFAADDGVNGEELWVSDGTAAGTTLLKDVNPAAGEGGGIRESIAIGDTLYFYSDDGQHGLELWASDGTEAGTQLVRDINPGSVGSLHPLYGEPDFFDANGVAVFLATDGTGEATIWQSDGTSAGTHPLFDNADDLETRIFPIAALQDQVVFTANDGDSGW